MKALICSFQTLYNHVLIMCSNDFEETLLYWVQVKALESVVLGGGKVLDKEVQNLIELLMTQAIKLEKIVADGDVKQERRSQVYFSDCNQSSILSTS